MSFVTRSAAHCDVCGHEWLTSGQPTHCAKCKSRKWNTAPKHWAGEVWNASPHDPKTCRLYKCGMCAAAKGKAKD